MEFTNSPAALVIFFATVGLSLYAMYANQGLFHRWVLNPYTLYHDKKYSQVITSGLLHADMMHLLFNMVTFYFFAFQLESIIGTVQFVIIYFGSMILSDISTIIKHKDNPNYNSVGASGAIAGVLFSFILFSPMSKIMIFPIPIPIPAFIFGILYLVWCWYAARKAEDMINHDAHFWGALAGVVITLILNPQIVTYFLS
jgi:membrane associated rhomboid family serine protease